MPAMAVLGNIAETNEAVYGSNNYTPKYNKKGSKDVVIYNSDNALVTVVYKNDISILENISYINAVEESKALADIKKLIISSEFDKPKFTSSMDFVNGYFTELIYGKGVRVKVVYDHNGNVTEIISSMDSVNDLTQNNGN